MNDPWYQPRFVTCLAAIALMAAFVTLNTLQTDTGVYRVYLDEGEKLCVGYRGYARGWPQTYAVKYVLDEQSTTLLGFPKRKFIDDEYDARPLWANVFVAFVAFVSATLVLESTGRLIALRPKRVREEPRRRMVSEIRPVSAQQETRNTSAAKVPTKAAIASAGRPLSAKQGAKFNASPTKAAIMGKGRPITSKQNAKPAGRPASIKQKPKGEEPKARPASVKPALAARRQEDLKGMVKA